MVWFYLILLACLLDLMQFSKQGISSPWGLNTFRDLPRAVAFSRKAGADFRFQRHCCVEGKLIIKLFIRSNLRGPSQEVKCHCRSCASTYMNREILASAVWPVERGIWCYLKSIWEWHTALYGRRTRARKPALIRVGARCSAGVTALGKSVNRGIFNSIIFHRNFSSLAALLCMGASWSSQPRRWGWIAWAAALILLGGLM